MSDPRLENLKNAAREVRERKLFARGNPIQTLLAQEFDLHEHPWPHLLGDSRAKWEQVAAFVERAARHRHQRECIGNPTGRGGPFSEHHAEIHQQNIRMMLVDMLAAGIPEFLAKKPDPTPKDSRT